MLKNKTAFSGYAQSYKIDIVQKRDVVTQLKTSEISIKELFEDLLIELKRFKYQITLAVLLSKVKNNGEIEYPPVYFNSLTKIVIGSNKFGLNQAFQEIIYGLDNLTSHGSGWFVEEIYNQYINISSYLPLSASTYIKLPDELNHPKKGLFNIQKYDNKCFVWCHVRHLNLIDKNLQRITEKFLKNLIIKELIFQFLRKIMVELKF